MPGSTIRLRRQIPYCLAAEVLLTGRHVTAQEALDWGLINRVVPRGEALAGAREMAAAICANGSLAVRAVSRSLREQQETMAGEVAMARSDVLGWPLLATDDAWADMKAFKYKIISVI